MARRLGHGETITIQQFDVAREGLADSVADVPLAFAAAQPVDLKDFDFLFPDLQSDPNNLLPEAATTPANLVRLGKTMIDNIGNDPAGDSDISAIMTYFGQFIDHDITLELASADLPTLTSPALTPLPLDEIRNNLKNARSATLDLDSVYDLPAARDGDKMLLGRVSPTGSPTPRLVDQLGKMTSTTSRAGHGPQTRPPTGPLTSVIRATTRTLLSPNCTSHFCGRTTNWSTDGTPSRSRAALCANTTSTLSFTTF